MKKTSNKDLLIHTKPLSRKVRIVEPYPITHQFLVEKEFAGKSLLELMSIKFPFQKGEEWEHRIREKRVYLDSDSNATIWSLKEGETIYHHNPSVIEPTVPDEIEILKETENYLIVYKPSPLPMHPGGRYNKNSLTRLLEEKGFSKLRITHRLDAVTSGIVLFAKTKDFAKQATECFTNGRVKKEYLAIVLGHPNEETKTITSAIKRKYGFVFESGKGLENAKEATTHFEVLEKREHSSVIKCIPETGRTHQIRLHLAEWGFPIVDDPIYGHNGDQSSKTTQRIGISLISNGLEIEELGITYYLNSER